MRIWSLHPKYLDAKGIVALWRETLLAKQVLEGKTKGYKNHPQLDRFKKLKRPLDAINAYLATVYEEALARGYSFDQTKINRPFSRTRILVNSGQLEYEFRHLLKKLEVRDPERLKQLQGLKSIEPNRILTVTEGGIEAWEIL
ncbi:pyrimidine dimer DNA glycosylase/endonuclease V [Niabella beijingensis]|uniref:pyrimidine dimer DNA glycosylase/endonuclease V n=1 Tax=Niabella beijingensis TaxID=2872700 RepID=UPI001CBC767B|nr:pyrimidine dimer DNA glycosylase/endonuclease V [Niabella beijingensis]MBZ4190327.1 pyrimidine dimer DNA glycosylase/endonuclease V [Niabella beijingensis]